MKIQNYQLIAVLAVQLILVNGLQKDDTGYIGHLITLLINMSKYFKSLHPFYPNANKDAPPNEVETYDFIIVGAGPSGCTLANRLSENPNWRILLLEAGGEPSLVTDVPLFAGALTFSEFNWGYRTEKQKGFCRGCIDGNMIWPHGKVLGGTSIINYMIFVRGNKRDYQKWAQQGNPGWSYEEVLPYFIKAEDAHLAHHDRGLHGTGGPVNVTDVPYRTKSADVWVQAATEAGYPFVDYNGNEQYGVSYAQATQGYGKRWSAEKAYLRPIRHRPNLIIRTNALVSKVLIREMNTAYGVEYKKNEKYRTVLASKEVILSAGSQNTPQILMLSGIGPDDHLKELGIEVVKNLPVGKQMYDHATFPALQFRVNDSITLNQFQLITNPSNFLDFINKDTGPLTLIGGVEALTYFKSTAFEEPDPKYPDIELIFVGGSLSSDFGLIFRRFFNIPRKTYNKIWRKLETEKVFMILPMHMHPKSKGFIKLRSKNPEDAPLFYVNFFSDPENHDIKAFISAIREVQRIVSMPAFQKYDARIVDDSLPGCEDQQFNSDEYWECALRTLIGSLWHQVATCKMGPQNNVEAVVDNELRVYGINKLRVVDTSIIPVTLTAHTVASAYMIGEKAADIIKNTWKE